MTGILQSLLGSVSSAVAVVTDAYFNLVTLLLPGNGTNGAQNNTFLDSSTNNFTITRNGNTTQGTFSPFSQTGWGNFFNGSTDYLLGGNSTAYTLGTGDFSIEFWIYPTSSGSLTGVFGTGGASTGTIQMQYRIDKKVRFNVYLGSTIETSTTCEPGVWNHIVITRAATGIARIFQNGVLRGYVGGSFTDNLAGADLVIGRNYNNLSQEYFPGYISNFRFIKGSIPTTYQTSATADGTTVFTPPTTALTTTSQGATGADVSILTCQSNRFVDNSTTSVKTITTGGTPSVQAFSPFTPTAAYSAATNGGSGYFDGSGDNISVPSATALQLNTSVNWTIEAWVYPTTLSGDNGIIAKRGASTEYQLSHNSGTGLNIYTGATTYGSGKLLTVNQWQHCAATWDGTTLRFFVNGVQTPTTHTGISLPASSTNNFTVGANGTTEYFSGYICDARLVKGTAVYTASFTPPTAPLTAITNTSFLCNFTNAGITDATAKNDLETVGNAQISTTQSKFGGSSMYFDGTGDWAIVPANAMFNLGTSDFTIEGWFYLTTTASAQYFLGTFATSPNRGWFAYFDTTLKLAFTYSTTGSNAVDAGFGYTPSTNTWVHFAFVRSGADLKFYANGTQQGSTHNIGTSSIYANTQPLYIGERGSATGAAFNGYIDDLRITRYARYTANFTAPTAAFPVQ